MLPTCLAILSERKLWSSASVLLLLIVLSLVAQNGGKFIRDDRFMSDVNLEHYYVIEENILSNADVLLRDDYFGADEEEDEEEHLAHAPNLTNFKSIIDETKAVHRLAGPHLESFLAHPINMYHLFRRLDNGWREGIDLLLLTKPCRTWHLPSMVGRLRYLKANLPGKRELERVVGYLATLQRIHKLKAQEIANGKIGDFTSLRPLALEDQFEIVKVLHEQDEMRSALQWLQQISELLAKLSPSQKAELDFDMTDVLSMMASAYYHMRNTSEALKMTEQVLKTDPSNAIAKSNHMFFKNKLAIEKEREQEDTRIGLPSPETTSSYERLCARKRFRKPSKKKCRLVRNGLMFYKIEVIRRKPNIVIYHDIFRNKTCDILKNFAHDKQTEQAWIREEKFRAPKFNVEMNLEKLGRLTPKREMRRLLRYLSSLTVVERRQPWGWGQLQIINVGLEGMHLWERHKDLMLYVAPVMPVKSTGDFGAYFVFLNDVKIGGEVVLLDEKIKLFPEKGSVLFYHTSKTSIHSFCPVIGGSLWVAVQPLYEKKKNYCSDEDEWL